MHAAPAFHTDDPAEMHEQVGRITDMMEHPTAVRWEVSDAQDDDIANMLGAITGVRLTISAIEGIARLSQNRPQGHRASVLSGFTHSPDPGARRLAAAMKKV